MAIRLFRDSLFTLCPHDQIGHFEDDLPFRVEQWDTVGAKLDAGERYLEESDIRSFKTDTEAINWLALEADRRGFTRWQCVQE